MADLALETDADQSGPFDLAAFERILIRHQRQVYLTALRLLGCHADAQDAAQEVFLRLYRHWRRFDAGRDLSAWLYRVTVNVCRDLAKRRGGPVLPLDEAAAGGGAGPEDEAGAAERQRILEQALRRLPEKERAAVVLRDLEGLSTAAVARILGSSETTVRSQISSARLKIRQFTERFRRGGI